MFFTVFTPCYKSTATLLKAYKSLENQTIKDFEWILIDDHSQDETPKMILEIANKASFPVKYKLLEQNHYGGKSLYEASLIASGKCLTILDHDDILPYNALENAKKYLLKYGGNSKIGGLIGRCINEKGVLIGRPFKNEVEITDYANIRYKDGILSEMMTFIYTNIIIEHNKVMKAGYYYGVLWEAISEKYNFIFVNDVFRVYDTVLETSFTNSPSVNVRYSREKLEMIFHTLNRYRNYLHFQPKLTFRQLVHANYLMLKYSIKPDLNMIKYRPLYLLLFAALPFGLLKFFLKKIKII